MACDTKLKPQQTISQRAEELRKAQVNLEGKIAAGKVKIVISRQGAILFDGWTGSDRDGVTDACAYRRIMATGNATTKAAITRAELMSGRSINRQVIGQGVHSHDGGASWHSHKG